VAVCVLTEDSPDAKRGGQPSFLLVQRPDTGLLASLWEFPTVPVPEGASEGACKKSLSSYLRAAAALQRDKGAKGAGRKSASVSTSASTSASALWVDKMKYVGDIDFLFSHIRQTLKIFKMSVGSRDDCQIHTFASSSSSATRNGAAAGRSSEEVNEGPGGKQRGAKGREKSKSAKAAAKGGEEEVAVKGGEEEVICLDDEKLVAGGSWPAHVRWLAEEELENAALPTVRKFGRGCWESGRAGRSREWWWDVSVWVYGVSVLVCGGRELQCRRI